MTGTIPRVTEEAAGNLVAAMRGPVILPDDARYEDARAVYNGMIDRRPALIARCVDAADVKAAVDFAREHELLVAVRGGGHHGAGLGTCDGGLVIDLSPMKGVRVDGAARTALVMGGATLADVDHATHAYGLAAPFGIVAGTGVGGLTLGGGLGHLTRRFGLSIDNLLAADLVLADGTFVSASADQHPDLFWAIRGGGGNFGVVTSFQFRLHPLSTVYGGPMLWPLDRAEEILRWYREFLPAAPDDLNGFFAFTGVLATQPFPEHLWGSILGGIVWCYTGRPDDAEQVFAPIRDRFGPPALDWCGPIPHPQLQGMFDPLYPPGYQWYWKADFFTDLSDEAIACHVDHGSQLPTLYSTMHLYPIDGAAGRVPADDTAWSWRGARWGQVIAGISPDAADTERMIAWARAYWEALHPHSAGGAYVNMMMEEGQGRVRAAYGAHYDRLASIKARYDPANLFRMNQNILPSA
jgi:FAD/FMN-containing dehydrogenase